MEPISFIHNIRSAIKPRCVASPVGGHVRVKYRVIFPCGGFAIILDKKKGSKLEIGKANVNDTVKSDGEEG
jgi:hypothetical protein